MKKSKIMALALTAAVALSGVGYAYWSDSVKINNTVATGEFNVQFVQDKDFTPYIVSNEGKTTHYVGGSIVQNDTPTATVNTDRAHLATVKVDNLYPGTYAHYWLKVQNTGTIPAVFDGADILFNDANGNDYNIDQNLREKIVVGIGYYLFNADGTQKKDANGKPIQKGLYVTGLDNVDKAIDGLLKDVRLEKDEFLKFDVPEDVINELKVKYPVTFANYDGNSVFLILPEEINNDDNVEAKSVQFDIQLNWKQHNNPTSRP